VTSPQPNPSEYTTSHYRQNIPRQQQLSIPRPQLQLCNSFAILIPGAFSGVASHDIEVPLSITSRTVPATSSTAVSMIPPVSGARIQRKDITPPKNVPPAVSTSTAFSPMLRTGSSALETRCARFRSALVKTGGTLLPIRLTEVCWSVKGKLFWDQGRGGREEDLVKGGRSRSYCM
jgi:hypothetical protein